MVYEHLSREQLELQISLNFNLPPEKQDPNFRIMNEEFNARFNPRLQQTGREQQRGLKRERSEFEIAEEAYYQPFSQTRRKDTQNFEYVEANKLKTMRKIKETAREMLTSSRGGGGEAVAGSAAGQIPSSQMSNMSLRGNAQEANFLSLNMKLEKLELTEEEMALYNNTKFKLGINVYNHNLPIEKHKDEVEKNYLKTLSPHLLAQSQF